MQYLFFLLALGVSMASAATLEPSRAIGDTHNCTAAYPEEAARNYEEGNVTVQYDVDATGAIGNVSVAASSGNPSLDQAAVTCVATAWKNTPATSDGEPVASPGHKAIIVFAMPPPQNAYQFVNRGKAYEARGQHDRAIVDFTMAIALAPLDADAYRARAASYEATGRHNLAAADLDKLKTIPSPARVVGDTHNCADYYPEDSREASETGDVMVRYDVGIDGGIGNVAIKVSSGSQRFDDAALACVRERWRDTPAILDGKPVASPDHNAVISFRLEGVNLNTDFVAQGEALLKQGSYFAAVQAFSRAIAQDANAAEAYRGRAMAYDSLGRFDLASADRNKLVALRAAHPGQN